MKYARGKHPNSRNGFKKNHGLNKGNKYALGHQKSSEVRAKTSERMKGNRFGFKKGQPSPRKGKKASVPAWNKGKKLLQFSGPNHPNWISDRSKLKKSEKKHLDGRYRDWMRAVKGRDEWTCKIKDGNCDGRLEAHHILNWVDYPELRYNTDNGISLCAYHHPRKREEEMKLSTKFFELIGSDIPYLTEKI